MYWLEDRQRQKIQFSGAQQPLKVVINGKKNLDGGEKKKKDYLLDGRGYLFANGVSD